ncbi:MAG: hypothetical protein ACREOU_04915 [Candidatus Eiseniibacteriota bacterium]
MKLLRTLPPLALGLLVLSGCGQQNPVATNESTTAETYAGQAGVQSETAALPDEFEVSTYADGEAAKPDMSDFGDASFGADAGVDFGIGAGGTPTTLAPIDPAFWFRLIRRHERRFIVEFEKPDTMTVIAHVRIVDRLLGTFNVVTKPDTIEGEIVARNWIQKPLADTGVRKAVFKRTRIVRDGTVDDGERDREDLEDGHRDGWSRWRLVALSGVEVTSDDGTRRIASVRIQSGDVDATITDPLELIRVRAGLIHLPPGTPVLVTVQTGDPEDVVVLYARWGRMRFRPGDVPGTWVARFRTPLEGGLRHIAVNALSHGTLFDDAEPYDSKAWGIPFVVAPTLVAEDPAR